MNETVPKTHKERFNELFPYVREYQKLASEYKINDIFQDNGGKYLQLLMLLDLTTDGAREGNDAIDAEGNEYEIKTVNIDLQRSFTTHHHLNDAIIKKYRQVEWYFAPFENIELQVIYKLTPENMEPYYKKWERMLEERNGQALNNPKITLTHVMTYGEIVWLPPGVKEFVRPKAIRKRKANAISTTD